MRVLICDDDDVLRKVVGGVAQAAGHDVVAETDNANDAMQLVERLVPEIVVLDLALAYGTGTQLMTALRAEGTASKILVFSAFATDRAALMDGGATAVVEKPDFDGLEQVLRAWAKQAPGPQERRRERTTRLLPGSTARSPGGLEPDREFYAALGATIAGDALLVLWIESYGLIVGRDGAHVGADWLMELARITRGTIRAQDRMACFDGRRLHVLLVGGRGAGPAEVRARVGAGWSQIAPQHSLGSSFAVCEDDVSVEQLLHWVSPAPV